MHQYWFLNCNKCATLIQNINKKRLGCRVDRNSIWEICPFDQFFCKPKTALNKESLFIKKANDGEKVAACKGLPAWWGR